MEAVTWGNEDLKKIKELDEIAISFCCRSIYIYYYAAAVPTPSYYTSNT
tara:strand:- start:428 stop:574 length:147 start_codon:yes stop_codon:yes gene_type:complete